MHDNITVMEGFDRQSLTQRFANVQNMAQSHKIL